MTQTRLETIEPCLPGGITCTACSTRCSSQQPQRSCWVCCAPPFTAQALGLFAADDRTPWPKALNGCRACPPRLADPDIAEAVENEYMHLFIGPGKLPAPPWSLCTVARGVFVYRHHPGSAGLLPLSGYLPQGYPHVADDSLGLSWTLWPS